MRNVIYSVLWSAVKSTKSYTYGGTEINFDYQYGCRLITANSPEEAEGIVYKKIHSKFPVSGGWERHTASSQTITRQQIEDIFNG